MIVDDEADPDLVAGVAADLAAVEDWSVFWHPVWPSFQGRDYGGAVVRATGWNARYDNLGPSSGPESVTFALPHGGFVSAGETSVLVTSPELIWSATLERDQLTTQRHQHARALAASTLNRYADIMARHLGQPDIGPIGYFANQAPAGLLLEHDGVIAAWSRSGGSIQLAAIELNDYETEPIDLQIGLQVLPARTSHHD